MVPQGAVGLFFHSQLFFGIFIVFSDFVHAQVISCEYYKPVKKIPDLLKEAFLMSYNDYENNAYEADYTSSASSTGGSPDGAYSYSYVPPRQYTAPDASSQPEAPKRKRGRAGLKVIALCLVCALLGGAAGFGASFLAGSNASGGSSTASPSPTVVLGSQNSAENVSGVLSADSTAASRVYAENVESCVGIETDKTTNVFGQEVQSAITGSGFIVSSDGYIATNYHVVQTAMEENLPVKVMLHDGSEYTAKIIGGEEDNDIAVLKIDATGLKAVSFGDSDALSVGEAVYAVGNPLGELTYTMTGGMVSALDRVITTEVSSSINVFQIDAAINSGNSGGPVFNAKGEVVGVATAKAQESGVEGLGFAIPINDALHVIQELIEHGYVTGKPYFGMTVTTVNSTSAQYYHLVEGVCVNSVNSGSAAEKAGLQPGDIITAIDGKETLDIAALDSVKREYSAGDTVELSVYRSGETLTLQLTFDEARPTGASN